MKKSSTKNSPDTQNSPDSRILNCLPSRDQQNDWRLDPSIFKKIIDFKLLTVDLRDGTNWKVGNQGSSGSCVGFAIADGLLRKHFAKNNILKLSDRLSVKYLWMAAKETDRYTNYPTTFMESEGTYIKDALDVVRKFGIVREEVIPYNGPNYYGKIDQLYSLAAKLRIANYNNLGTNLSDWRNWLYNHGTPIVVRLNVDSEWYNATANKGNMKKYNPSSAKGGHAVCIVGCTPSYFIIRNSWGESWGDKGFGYAYDSYAAAAFTEAYVCF